MYIANLNHFGAAGGFAALLARIDPRREPLPPLGEVKTYVAFLAAGRRCLEVSFAQRCAADKCLAIVLGDRADAVLACSRKNGADFEERVSVVQLLCLYAAVVCFVCTVCSGCVLCLTAIVVQRDRLDIAPKALCELF